MKNEVQNGVAMFGLLTAAAIALSGCAPSCAGVYEVDTSPVVVEFFESAPADVVVSACFGETCEPVEAPAVGAGRWEVPQEEPYLDEFATGTGKPLHVVVDYGANTYDNRRQMPTSTDQNGSDGECGGPWHYEPVVLSIPDWIRESNDKVR